MLSLYVYEQVDTIEFKILLQKCIINLEFMNEAIQFSHFGISPPHLISISEINTQLIGLYKLKQLLNLKINYSIISIIRTDMN